MATYEKNFRIKCRWCKKSFEHTARKEHDSYTPSCHHCCGSNPIDNRKGFIPWFKNHRNNIKVIKRTSL